jgi:hypothetical protein
VFGRSRVIGGEALPRADGLRFDPGVALFAAAIVGLAGIAVGCSQR